MTRSPTYLIVFPLGHPLLPPLLLVLLFGPGGGPGDVLLRSGVLVLLLGEHLPPLFLPVFVLVADGVGVHRRLDEVRKGFAPQFGHLGQAEQGESPS